ncbi:MAG: threonine dehydratase [Burkholderiales bacterium]|jgi:threonine dehydratase|nr:threonine dehydratase [Burkholderiales bacterium]MCE3268929.1 threonine dehydratase [Burkholderiales bacterium]
MIDRQLKLNDIEAAAKQLENIVINTPLQFSERLSGLYNANIYIKREDLQRCRSFKVRGAYNKIVSLSKTEQQKGIVCASAGNHAQGVAYSCSSLKILGTIFMPLTTPLQKIDKVKQFGGKYIEIITIGDTYDDANAHAVEYSNTHDLAFVHPFDDYAVMCGQATVAKEIYEELGDKIDTVLIPIGGGGLAAGMSSFLKQQNSKIEIIGVEPDGAPGMSHSIEQGYVSPLESIDTFVDGAAVKRVGDATFAICNDNLDATVLVPEGKICTTMIELYQLDGIIAEPAGALSISVLDTIKEKIKGKTVICILCGGNNDILRYPEIMERSLVYNGRKHYFIIEFNQKPGQLRKFLNEALGPHDDIVRFEYMKKTNRESGAALVGIELYSRHDFNPLLERMEKTGINFRILSNKELLYSYII